MKELTDERKGQIALAYLRAKVKKDAMPAASKINEVLREIGNTVAQPDLKKIGVTKEEGIAFVTMLLEEASNELIAGLKKAS